MRATMMHEELGTAAIVEHGERIHASSRISYFDGQDLTVRTFAETAGRARRLASALQTAGAGANTRIATLCWNDFCHFEAYLAVPAMGAVLHTLNLRLLPEQLRFIMADADDRFLIADGSLLTDLIEHIDSLPSLELVIVVGDDSALGAMSTKRVRYEDFIAGSPPLAQFPVVDETAAAAVCYTSGTTGNPKGVVYSHRTIYLHSLASMAANAFGLSEHDRILLLPPMFHANAWGLPFSGWLAGADFILPGPHLQSGPVRTLIERCAPTFTATVPTILNDLLRADESESIDMASFRLIVAGGSAVSHGLVAEVASRWKISLVQGWGMTETSPLCVLSHPPADAKGEDSVDFRARSGRPVAGVRVRIVDADGAAIAEDGESVGRLQLRGPWIASGYHGFSDDALSEDGWLETGDAGTIDQRGYVQVTDRLKDLIKSGGEWIPSAELENHVTDLPGINLAAIIGVPDPRWEERPLAIVTTVDGRPPDFGLLRNALAGRVARFWIPEYWAHTENLPLTTVGKIDKQALRHAVTTGTIQFERCEQSS